MTDAGLPLSAGTLTVARLAALVTGAVVGDGTRPISGVADPHHAVAGDLVFLLDVRYAPAIRVSAASAVVTDRPLGETPLAQIVVAQPRLAMARIMALFAPVVPYTGVHPTAVVDSSAQVAPTAAIGPGAVIGARARIGAGTVVYPLAFVGEDVLVGADCRLYPHVVLYHGVELGDRVILHAGTVVGSDGYGYAPDAAGNHLKVPQLGTVQIGDDVETGANVAIDRGTLGPTVIGRGTKIDNLVHIGHNNQIGENVLLVSQTGLSGSVTVGDGATLAGQVGVAGHLKIGPRAMVLARSGVTKDIPADAMVSGFPARPHREELRRAAAHGHISRLQERVQALEARLAALEGRSLNPPDLGAGHFPPDGIYNA